MTSALPSVRSVHEDLLLEEYKEAWAHYRHTESLRTQYVGFFFTAVLGSLAVSTAIADGRTPPPEGVLLTAAFALIWLLTFLALMLFTSVWRAGYVLKTYVEIIDAVRTIAYRDLGDEDRAARNALRVTTRSDGILSASAFSTGRSYQILLGGAAALLGAGQLALACVIFIHPRRPSLEPWELAVVATMLLACLLYSQRAARDILRVLSARRGGAPTRDLTVREESDNVPEGLV